MIYTIQGTIRGILCNRLDVIEYPTDGKVRLYRPDYQDNVDELVAANPKQTLSIVTDRAVSTKANRLLAEATIDGNGQFEIKIDGRQVDYGGAPLDIDLYLERMPNQKDQGASSEPLQLHITTIAPKWQQHDNGAFSEFDYTFTHINWCELRRRFGAWVILGRVGICTRDRVTQGLPNLTVTAFDDDWLQNDTLGSAISNANGFFRIDYMEADFKQTFLSPLINIETLGAAGPDVYFTVYDGSDLVLEESIETDVRKDVSPCLCVQLCVGGEGLGDFPYFTSYGDVPIDATNGALSNTGLVTKTVETNETIRALAGDGFFGKVELGGYIPDSHPTTGKQTRYRFMYAISDSLATPNEIVKGNVMANTVVSYQIMNPSDPTSSPLQPIEVRSTAPATPPTDRTIVVQDHVDGWIEVIANTIHSGYANPLLTIKTTEIVAGGNPIATGANGQRIWLQMQVEDIDGNGRINSAIYPMYINNWVEFRSMDLSVDLCSELSGDLPLTYEVDHELLQQWAISISTTASGFVAPTLPSGTTPRGDAGTVILQTASWQPCVYTIRLTGRRKLTTGLERDDSSTLRQVNVYINNSSS